MNYLEEIRSYSENLKDDYTKQQLLKAVKTLRQQEERKSFEWIYTALTQKKPADWNKWGFGLLFNWNYQAQIDNKLRVLKQAQQIDIDDAWAQLEAEEEEEIRAQEGPRSTIFEGLGTI